MASFARSPGPVRSLGNTDPADHPHIDQALPGFTQNTSAVLMVKLHNWVMAVAGGEPNNDPVSKAERDGPENSALESVASHYIKASNGEINKGLLLFQKQRADHDSTNLS
jgi:hypothetical protein